MKAKTEKWEQAGFCGVDAGLIWIGDPCYIIGQDATEQPAESWSDFCKQIENMGASQQFKYKHGHDGLGVCIGDFGGDGCYSVYVKKDSNGRVLEAKIVFSE